jgi:hypothetical protein
VKRKLIWLLVLLVLFVSLYWVVFRTRSVTYQGEDKNWLVEINAKLVGLNGSYNIEIQYKGRESINDVDYNIYPHYQGGYFSLNGEGSYSWECDSCGYYDKDEELLFFITWREGKSSDEKVKWITLRKK